MFLSSDGYADQHNSKNKKIGSKRLRLLLEKYGDRRMEEIGEVLNEVLDKHQGEMNQRDDITIAGIKL